MKKLLAMLLALVMVLALAACGAADDAADDAAADDAADTAEFVPVTEGCFTMATSADFAPYEFHILNDAGEDEIVGFDVALGQAIADKLGLELVIKDMDFDSLIMEVQNGSVDIAIAGFSVDPERAEVIDFSDVYYTGSQSFMILAEDAELYDDYADFAGIAVAAQTGTIQADLLAENIPDANQVLLANMNDIILQLVNNKVEGAFVETVVAENYIATYPELKIAWEVPDDSEGSAAVVAKGNTALLAVVNEVIADAIADGSMDQWVADAIGLTDQAVE